ncbi:MAG TPA: hypothetical protein VGJ20_44830 [Xanthobacteraceae bacterium]
MVGGEQRACGECVRLSFTEGRIFTFRHRLAPGFGAEFGVALAFQRQGLDERDLEKHRSVALESIRGARWGASRCRRSSDPLPVVVVMMMMMAAPVMVMVMVVSGNLDPAVTRCRCQSCVVSL